MARGKGSGKLGLKKRDAQDRVLVLLAQGHTVEECMKAVGRTRDAYYQWRRDDPWFAERTDAIRRRADGGEPKDDVESFVELRKAYFGMDTPAHQRLIIEAITSAPSGSITMVLMPPGGGKTTVLEDFYNITLGKNPNHRFCVISESRDLGRKILRRVANRMEDHQLNPAYIDAFGPFKPADRGMNKPWNADMITHVQAHSGERDYSLEVKGAGSTIYGAQFDDIVLDDIQSLKTLEKTPKLLDYFRQDVFTRMMRANSKGRIFIVGTRVGPGDFYEELQNLDIDIRLVSMPALVPNPETGELESYFPPKVLPEGGVVGFSMEDLAAIEKIVGPETWARVYMQEPQSKFGQTFTDDMLNWSKNESRGIDPRTRLGVFRIASLDPAIAGHASFKVSDIDFEKLYLRDTLDLPDASRYETLWDRMEELTIQWHPNVWVIEGNNIQGGLLRSDRVRAMEKKYGFSIVAHQTGRNKQDDMIGVASMAGPFLRREIDIPWGDSLSQEKFGLLFEQLKKWRPDIPTRQLVQDEVMSLWFTVLEWDRRKSMLACGIDKRVKARGLPWKPTGYGFVKAGR